MINRSYYSLQSAKGEQSCFTETGSSIDFRGIQAIDLQTMSAFLTVNKLIEEWQPPQLPNELQYRNSLTELLRKRLPKATVETEYRHSGTTIDIYVKEPGLVFGSSEVFAELKRNLLHKAQLDRLVGQIESLQPGKNPILVVLCGETSPALVTRFKEKNRIGSGEGAVVFGPGMSVVVKSDVEKTTKT